MVNYHKLNQRQKYSSQSGISQMSIILMIAALLPCKISKLIGLHKTFLLRMTRSHQSFGNSLINTQHRKMIQSLALKLLKASAMTKKFLNVVVICSTNFSRSCCSNKFNVRNSLLTRWPYYVFEEGLTAQVAMERAHCRSQPQLSYPGFL